MPKIVNHVDRRLLIIEKALVIFAQQGFYSTNYNEIAQVCGLSRTGLYQYFPNKEAVFKETVEHVVDTIAAARLSKPTTLGSMQGCMRMPGYPVRG